jgi:hypothetical protein
VSTSEIGRSDLLSSKPRLGPCGLPRQLCQLGTDLCRESPSGMVSDLSQACHDHSGPDQTLLSSVKNLTDTISKELLLLAGCQV